MVGTINLLDAMRDKGVSQIIFSSTCATYGIPHAIPISEDHPQKPINPYGHSKLMNERMLADLNVAYGIHSISLRYFNAAGADPEGEIGEKRDAEGHLIPLVLQVAAGARPNITIFGIDYDTPDGTCIRDYVHVTDLAEAHVLALLALSRYKSASYNLGTGRGFSVREVIRTAQSITGQNITAKEGPRRAGDPPHLVADASRVQAELGWKARYVELDQIISTAWTWLSEKEKEASTLQPTGIV